MKRRENPSRLVAIDLILRTFMNTSGFNEMEPKNWNAISRLIPGSTPQECMRRFEDLKHNTKSFPTKGNPSSLSAEGRSALTTTSGSGSNQLQPGSAESGDQSISKEIAESSVSSEDSVNPVQDKKATTSAKSAHQFGKSPNMVIHVCDEAKNVKKDFKCPRDLLVVEMKYFAEYLSNDAQHWEDVDISVHCDVQIFDWLMSYVKRDLPEFKNNTVPSLEAGNVVSILISSDFLKMDGLVEDCIQFCHEHMSHIIATPCNMNCINDRLCTRIAALFTDCEVENIKDKKDKFKSKLFMKKIESLLGAGGTGSTLFRCQHCKLILTKDTMKTVQCLANRVSISKTGSKVYYHGRETGWDVNDHLLRLKKELKSWGNVYWRLWGSVNLLDCAQCKQRFPCSEFLNCSYHPEKANFMYPGLKSSPVGTYSCCDKKIVRFDYLSDNSGCQVTEHVISAHKEDQSEGPTEEGAIYEILQRKKNIICTAANAQDFTRSGDVNIFDGENSLMGWFEDNLVMSNSRGTKRETNDGVESEMKEFSTDDWESSDDEIGDEEHSRSVKSKASFHSKKRTLKKSSKQSSSASSSHTSGSKSQKWDAHRSLRWNQDTQREQDRHRLDDLTQHLIKQRQDMYSETQEKNRRKEYPGGLFNRLEVQFKSSLNISRPNPIPVPVRPKLRLGQVRAT
ncbi:SANT and BTB domain regulator of class switch recombination-like isoform X2 [Apostichopus japonicus]|uniref:SANT and BTB domain regulator of class switch recombination-like isoform X2 n=1 Tax=Stichopus japonicus TaxID=307972 RepID=UPI003AB68782